jgi:photosystem II stability/assembly factor-like uncharacterized protein
MRAMRPILAFVFLLSVGVPAQAQWWHVQTSGIDTNLRGVSAKFNEGSSQPGLHYFVWASGSNGVILRSTDDGKTWKQLAVAGGGGLDFRDIEAFNAEVAYVMSSGDGDKSRIYKTTDGGKTWKLQYSDKRPGFFLDSLACSSETHCLALSDPVDGKFLILSTDDGEHWKELPRDKMPAVLPKEGAFAASGTAIALCEAGIYFGTGGSKARIFHSADQGQSWTAVETPIASGNPSSGIFGIACEAADTLVAVGGDYREPARTNQVAIFSADAGLRWHLSAMPPGGYRSAVGSFSYGDFAAVGPNGTDVSHDGGISWKHTDKLNLNAVSFEGTQGWAVGPKGTIARFVTHFNYEIRYRHPQSYQQLAPFVADQVKKVYSPALITEDAAFRGLCLSRKTLRWRLPCQMLQTPVTAVSRTSTSKTLPIPVRFFRPLTDAHSSKALPPQQ